MEQVIATVLFDGQFWIILVEKIDDEGRIKTAKHRFGPEPTINDLAYFYDNIYPFLRFHESDRMYRPRKKYSDRELKRMESKSLAIYQEAQKAYLQEKKQAQREKRDILKTERYRLKCEKRKKKKKGH